MKFEPRPLQIDALRKLRESIGSGTKRVVLQASTGVGKTFIAAMIIENALKKGKRITFVAPYSVLINQTVERFLEQGLPLPGVMQGQHELTDASRAIQIATAQTLGRRHRPICDIVIVDEAHLQYKAITDWMRDEPEKIFIGLTATPFAKGMGKVGRYQDLIKIKSLHECLEDGTLSQYEVYGVETPDLTGVGMQNGDYKQGQLAEIMGDSKLVGNIVNNWLENGQNRQTIVFAVNVLHANKVTNDFESAGIKAEVITAKTPLDARGEMFKRFERRETRILVSVGCLIAGFDSYVDCIIWATPTKSAIKFLQGCGRGLRKSKGKDHCVIFDHSGTFTEMGFLEDVDDVFDELCDGEQKDSIATKDKEVKAEKKPKECAAPTCDYLKPAGVHECPKCGFAPRFGQDVEVNEEVKLKALKKPKSVSKEEKQNFYSEILGFKKMQASRGKSYSDGYFAHLYKGKFGVWPRGLSNRPKEPTPETLNYIKSRNIAFAKSRAKA